MPRWMYFINALSEWVGRIFSPVIGIIMLVGVYEVVARYVFNRPTTWAWEINEHLLCLFLALAGGYTLLRGRHVSVDLLYARFSPRVRAIIDVVSWLFFFLVCIVVIWQGSAEAWEATMKRERVLSSFNSPLYPDRWMIPIGTFLLLLQGIVKYTQSITAVIYKDKAAT